MKQLKLFMVMLVAILTMPLGAQQPCGFDNSMDEMMSEPGMDLFMQQQEEDLQEMIAYMESSSITLDVMIPVVVHIVHTGQPVGVLDNLDQARVTVAIANLNADFTGTGIQFCPAKRMQDGTPLAEPGIVRVNASSVVNYASLGIVMGSQREKDVKALGPQFSNFNYINIWVINMIPSGSSNGQVLGYGNFPNMADSSVDGVTIVNSIFGVSFYKILTHELGHFFNLYHSFQGDDGGTQCPMGDGDMVDDTDPHKRSSNDDCPIGDNICAGNAPLQNIVKNHMNYSMESCRDNFTEDQITRMQAAILESRPGLQNTIGCTQGCTPTFDVVFDLTPRLPFSPDENGDGGVSPIFTLYAPVANIFSIEWFKDGVPLDNSNTKNIEISFENPGIHIICVRVMASGCIVENCKKIFVADANSCFSTILPECELVRNGDMSSNKFNSSSTPTLIGTCGKMVNDDDNFICNWTDKEGTFDCYSNFIDRTGIMFHTLGVPNQLGEGAMTIEEIDLKDGESYVLSFDYLLIQWAKNNPPLPNIERELNIGLTTFDGGNDVILETINETSSHYIYSSNGPDLAFLQFGYISHSISFTYNTSMGKNLYFQIKNSGTDVTSHFHIENVSISPCPLPCVPDPTISIDQIDACSFSFTAGNNGDEGFRYWNIESGPAGMSDDVVNFTFSIPNTYRVCLTISCDDNTSVTECVDIVIGEECDDDCNITIADPTPGYLGYNAIKCAGSTEYVANLIIGLSPGEYLCRDDYVYFENGNDVNYYSTYVDDSNPYPVLHISVSFNSPPGGYNYITVCDSDGNAVCYNFYIGGTTECDECIDIVQTVTAACTDLDNTDNNLVYSGTFDITPGGDFIPCGNNVSTSPGYSQGTPQENNGTYTFPYSIRTNNHNPFNTRSTLCFVNPDDGVTKCFTVTIEVKKPCVVEPEVCEYNFIQTYYTVHCDEAVNGIARFYFSYALFSSSFATKYDGYELAGTRSGSSIGSTTVEDYGRTLFRQGYKLGFITEIDCIDLEGQGTITYEIEFEDENGNTFCVTLTVSIDCEECASSTIANRSLKLDVGTLYPNPASDFISIIVEKEKEEIHKLELFDSNGKRIAEYELEEGFNTLEISHLTPGIYIAKRISGEKVELQKIMIVR